MKPKPYSIRSQEMAESLARDAIWIADDLFDTDFSLRLYQQALGRHQKGFTKMATIGHRGHSQRLETVRGDHIEWIQDWEQSPELECYHQFLEELRADLSSMLFVALKRFEVHFSIYPPGTFYKKHLDQHRDSRHRQVSCIYYLSPWRPGQGGELKVYPKDKAAFEVQPSQGRFVCFLSGEIPHEVLTTHETRCALTGWYRDDAEELLS